MNSFENLAILENLYRLEALGFEYVEHFEINHATQEETPHTLEQLHTHIANCHLCDLSKSRTQPMQGVGNPHSSLFIVDAYVSSMQDTRNDYFAGRSGETLTNMITKVLQLPLENIYFTHSVKCKPLSTMEPSHAHFESCKSYLYTQLELVKPKVIMVLGAEAYAHLTGDQENFEQVRGHIIEFRGMKLIPIYHPQHLLRNPELKKITLNDLKIIKSCLM